GDFSPHDSGFRNASARASMSLHPTGSVSLNIPPEPIGPSVPHTHSDSDFGVRRFSQGYPEDRTPRTISGTTRPVKPTRHGFSRIHGIETIPSIREARTKLQAPMACILRRKHTYDGDHRAHDRKICRTAKERHMPNEEDPDFKCNGEP